MKVLPSFVRGLHFFVHPLLRRAQRTIRLTVVVFLTACPTVRSVDRSHEASSPSDAAQRNDSISSVDGSDGVFHASSRETPRLSWARTFGGVGEDEVMSVAVDAAGRIYAAGRFSEQVSFDHGASQDEVSSQGRGDAFVIAFNVGGGIRWARTFGGPGDDVARDLALLPSGEIVVVGEFEGTVDFGSDGTPARRRSSGRSDLWFARLTVEGATRWVRSVGGPGWDRADSVALGADERVVVAGRFGATIDFDPTDGTANATSRGDTDHFVAAYDGEGAYL